MSPKTNHVIKTGIMSTFECNPLFRDDHFKEVQSRQSIVSQENFSQIGQYIYATARRSGSK